MFEELLNYFPYILLYIFAVFNCKLNKNISNGILLLVLFLFSALRYDVGFDYMSYNTIVKLGSSFSLIGRMEPIERYIIELSSDVGFAQLFFIVNSFVIVFCVTVAIKRLSVNASISIFLFLCMPLMYLHSMSIIRFWAALSIVFLGITYLERGQYLRFLICYALALGFHNSAIISIVFIPLYYYNISLRLNWILLILSISLSSLIIQIVPYFSLLNNSFADTFIYYATKDNRLSGLTKIPYVFLAINLLFLTNYKLFVNNASARRMVTIYNIGCCIMFLFQFDPTLSGRLSRFFLIYSLFLIPYYIKKSYNGSVYKVILILIMGVLFFYTLSIFNASLNRQEFIPYKIFFYEI